MKITTIYGDMESSLLDKKEGFIDNDNEFTTWIEYYLNNELVHRSAHISLKSSTKATTAVGNLG